MKPCEDLSQKFDNWSPASFKLSAQEIERAIGQVAKRDLDDIRFAQAQVRNFAQKQKDTMHWRRINRRAAGQRGRGSGSARRYWPAGQAGDCS